MADVFSLAPESEAERLDALALLFTWFGQNNFAGESPLWERLSLAAAADPEVQRLCLDVPRRKLPPLLLLATVHHLVLRDPGVEPLAEFLPSAGGGRPPEEAYPAFRELCLRRAPEITALMTRRSVQTNEVRRSAHLMPALAVAERLLGVPLALLEIGPSAGLNLVFDRYAYDYGGGRTLAPPGDAGGRLVLECESRGPLPPPIPAAMPHIAARLGLDAAPIDVTDPEDAAWLRACLWPEQEERARRLLAAIEVARADPPPILLGDAVDDLPRALAALPTDAGLVVFHSYTAPYLGGDLRQRLVAEIEALGARRDLCWVSIEGVRAVANDGAPEWVERARADPEDITIALRLVHFSGGGSDVRYLARCHWHGAWIEWLDATSPG